MTSISVRWRLGTGRFNGPGLALLLLCFVPAFPAVAGPAVEPAPNDVSPEETFERRFVDFESQTVIIYSGMRPSGRLWTPYQGKYHRPLKGVAFYEAIERPDLAASYSRRNALDWSLSLGGWSATLGGLYLIADRHGAVGLSLVGVGVTALIAAWILEPEPVEEPEAREAADVYNKRLKGRLGLGPQQGRPPTPATTLGFVPFVTTSMGGLGMVGSF